MFYMSHTQPIVIIGVKEEKSVPVSACWYEQVGLLRSKKRERGYLRDEDGLVVAVLEHVMVGCIRDGKDMRSHLVPLFVLVREHHFVCVDSQFAVWVHCYQEESRICLIHIARIHIFHNNLVWRTNITLNCIA